MSTSSRTPGLLRRLGGGAPILLAAACMVLPLAGALSAAPVDPASPAGDAVAGAKLYNDHCARCHDDGGEDGRAPMKAELAARSPNEVYASLATGAMKTIAKDLSPDDLRALTVYLTGKSPWVATPAATTPDANPCAANPPLQLTSGDWNGWGHDAQSSRYQPAPGLVATDVARLKVKWAFAYPGVRNGQPTVIGDRVFLSSYGGRVYALDAATGCVHWRHDVAAGVRTALMITPLASAPSGYAAVFGDTHATIHLLDAASGQELWSRRVEDNPHAVITGSPVIFQGRIYAPVSSLEETIASDSHYGCCTFRGSVAALDLATGKLIWKTYAIPETPKPTKVNSSGNQMFGPAGAAIWSAPTIDAKRGVLYVGTGDSYTDVVTGGDDAIIAMDLATGHMRWTRQVTQNDNFLVGCGRKPQPTNCPDTVGPDYDFGASPVLHTLPDGRQILLVGQKSGVAFGLDPDHQGRVVWQAKLGAGSALGGIQWGMADDGAALYVAVSDVVASPLVAKPGLSALDPATGRVLWTTPSPNVVCAWGTARCSRAQSAAVTAIPGLVFSAAMNGHLRAYAAATGAIVWDFDTAAQTYAPVSGGPAVRGGFIDAGGPVVAHGMVFQHTGYGASNGGSNVLLAFSVDGR
jgi:polyvinyl alcohol dehydrogenase (cytochrome)